MKKAITGPSFQAVKKSIPFVLPALIAAAVLFLYLTGLFQSNNSRQAVISAFTPPASAGEPADSQNPAGPDDRAELEAYVECLRRFHERATELINESDGWIKGFAEFGNAANVVSFKQAVADLKETLSPLLSSAKTIIGEAEAGKWKEVAAGHEKYGDRLGRYTMLLAGMKANYQIEVKRKAEADRAVEDIEAFFQKTLAQMRDTRKILEGNLAIAASEKVKKRELRQFQLGGEYLIVAGKRLTGKMREEIVSIFPDAYKPGMKPVENPDPFTGRGVAGDDPLKPEGELGRLRELQKSGDYRAVLRLKYEVTEPLYSCRGYMDVLRDDSIQLRKSYVKELTEKRHEDKLYYMVWRIRTDEDGKVVETMDEWVDDVSWRRYDYWPLGTKVVKRRGELEEKVNMPKKQSEGENKEE
ncbi:MAG: hypothetical protein E3J72_21455 [Planctomycetota bacterium]|nr:MAG: hypothetical protein E3J72_21455 [Planctomycetota bacterium]